MEALEIGHSLFGIFAVIMLVLANGFFVAVEFAIVRSHITKFKEPELSGQLGVPSALRLINELDLSLSATQLGITVASLMLGWYGEEFFAELFRPIFLSFGHFQVTAVHATATAVALVLVTFLHVVIGELAAKSLAIRYPENTLRFLAPLMLFFTQGCRPVIFILNEAANLFLRLFGLRAAADAERVHTSGELSMLIAASTKHGALDKHEEEMLQGVFHFSETVAREIMTPRTDVCFIERDTPFGEVLKTVVSSGLSRFPVIGDNIDDVKGILLARDLLQISSKHFGSGTVPDFNIASILREAYFIPGTKTIDELLSELKTRKVHMAVVLDEHGGFDGVVTLEDILEEIVGDIFDESDGAKPEITYEESGDVLFDGGVLVTDINEDFEMTLPEGEYDTIAGFIFASLGRMAEEGDFVIVDPFGKISVNEGDGLSTFIDVKSYLSDEENDEDTEICFYKVSVEKISGNRIETVRTHVMSMDEIESFNRPNQKALPES